MPLIYRSIECLARRLLKKDTEAAKIVGCGLSGSAMLFFPNISIALYVFWKAIEMGYLELAAKGYAPLFKHGDTLLYTLSCGYVLGNAVIEPQSLRRSYYNFLCGLTGNKLKLFNRRLFKDWGFDSNIMFEDYVPTLDPKYTTINPDLYLPMLR
ncbi:hypothetical protein AAVH_00930 [Aphelenchoides avenae]|nr:hypothetical protein AAVH_00930 [Aphelenchus avenae]